MIQSGFISFFKNFILFIQIYQFSAGSETLQSTKTTRNTYAGLIKVS